MIYSKTKIFGTEQIAIAVKNLKKQNYSRFMGTMKVVLLAGGYGTRISEESHLRPKPMIEIGNKPILWHIMKCYSHYGFNEFVVCAGYKQHMIKEWFSNYFLYNSDVTFDFSSGQNALTVHHHRCEPWRVTIVDTGSATATGGRLKRIREYVSGETFMMTYGDGVCDVDIRTLVDFHKKHGKTATLTAVLQEQSKGILLIAPNGSVRAFREKKGKDAIPINVGWFWNRIFSLTSTVMIRRSKKNRWQRWQKKGS